MHSTPEHYQLPPKQNKIDSSPKELHYKVVEIFTLELIHTPKILNVSSGEKLRCRKVERVLRSKSMHIIYLSFFYPFLG